MNAKLLDVAIKPLASLCVSGFETINLDLSSSSSSVHIHFSHLKRTTMFVLNSGINSPR